MKTKKLIGIITDFCEDHSVYMALFPALNGFGIICVEGDITKLPLESQMMIGAGACIVAEISEEGEVLDVFCPPVEPLDDETFSDDNAENWLKKVRKRVGWGEGEVSEDIQKLEEWFGGLEDPPV